MLKVFRQILLSIVCLLCLYAIVFHLSGKNAQIEVYAKDITAGDMSVALKLVCSSFICLFLPVIALAVTWCMNSGKHIWNFLEEHLSWFFMLSWTLGFSVYMTGMYIGKGDDLSYQILHLVCQIPMACFYTFGMYAFQSDVSAVHSEFHSNLMFMSLFSFAHFLAAIVSLLFVLKYFGFAIVSKIRLLFATHIGKDVDKLYVFWGMNNASYYLAKSIIEQHKAKKVEGTYKILVVKTTEDEDEKMEANPISRMFSFVSFAKEELKHLKELRCLTENVFHRLAKADIKKEPEYQDILLEKMGATSLVTLIGKTKSKVHIFFLGNDEDNNIICTGNLCRDISIHNSISKDGNDSKKEISIYCHARYDSINRVVEDRYSSDKLTVKVIDSSHDSINILKNNENYHPINFVDVDTQENFGTVSSVFTSLVIGFGETGRDALRYLYEFGAFVDNSSAKEDDAPGMKESERAAHRVVRSNYKCYVVDREIDRLMGQFVANAPAMKGIEAWNDDVFSSGFYKNLKSICNDLNYVVVALGDDELNVTTAVRLFNFVRRYRKDMSRLAIFVRCHSDEHRKHLQNIADHYNQKQCGGCNKEHIVIFGTDIELYTYGQIIDNDFVREGKEYNEMYCKASRKWDNEWNARRAKLLKLKTLDDLAQLRRKESQDIANAYHAKTKISAMKRVVCDENGQAREGFETLHKYLIGDLPELSFKERQTTDKEGKWSLCKGIVEAEDTLSAKEELLVRNLARLEHIRWNAAHEVLGYQSFENGDKECVLVEDAGDNRHRCNETFKLHNCLIDWQDLDQETNNAQNVWHPDYKRLDFIVLTTSLLINKEKKEKEEARTVTE